MPDDLVDEYRKELGAVKKKRKMLKRQATLKAWGSTGNTLLKAKTKLLGAKAKKKRKSACTQKVGILSAAGKSSTKYTVSYKNSDEEGKDDVLIHEKGGGKDLVEEIGNWIEKEKDEPVDKAEVKEKENAGAEKNKAPFRLPENIRPLLWFICIGYMIGASIVIITYGYMFDKMDEMLNGEPDARSMFPTWATSTKWLFGSAFTQVNYMFVQEPFLILAKVFCTVFIGGAFFVLGEICGVQAGSGEFTF